MTNDERLLYQNNNLGYFLILGFIVLNTFYTVYVLNAMDRDSTIGVFVMLTIVMLLLGFLMAIKVKIYSILWCYIAIGVGAFQTVRVFFTINNVPGFFGMSLNVILVVSGVLCIIGGVISLNLTKLRQSLK